MNAETPWRVRTFGGFSVERNGVRFDRFRTQHALALLAYLSVRPDVRHSREVLADLLWPEVDPLTARQRLSNALANLRKELEANGPAVFAGGRESVAIHPGMLTSDAAEFNRLIRQARGASRERRRELLREALDLAEKGEFLPGIYFEWVLEQSSQFDEAMDAIRSELEAEESETAAPAEDPSSLVGRSAEIESLDRLLSERNRCISILGAGGIGKTRLALDLFERHARRFSGPTVFVRFAEVREPTAFLPALAQALHLPFAEAEALESAIAGALAVPGLVVLDNLEHLLPDIHPQLDSLLRSCRNSIFVCTSRRRLDVAGEQVVRVRPLPLASGAANLAEVPAIRLFVTRYREAGGPQLPPESLPAVEEICRTLGGLPLAIQLAASAAAGVGVETLHTSEMLHRLLPQRNPDATNVHGSLEELIQWSLTLLEPDIRQVLDALCILPGSFTLRIVQNLLGEEAGVALPTLHSDSLIEADGYGAMRVLEPIRDNVRAQMDERYRSELEIRLVRSCASLAAELEPRLEGQEQKKAFEEANSFWPTMRLAIQLATRHSLPNEGLTILVRLSRVFMIYMAAGDAVALFEPLLGMPGIAPQLLAEAHATFSRHAFGVGKYDVALAHATAGLALAKDLGNLRVEARCVFQVAYLAFVREDQDEALTLANQALAIGRRAGDRDAQVWSLVITGLAHSLYKKDASESQIEQARIEINARMEEAAAIARDAKDDLLEASVRYIASVHSGADIDLYRARLTRASEIYGRNGWKVREALARSALVFRLYPAGHVPNVVEEMRSLQRLYAEVGRWDLRAEQVGIEAEVLFRMGRLSEAQVAIEEAIDVLNVSGRYFVVEFHVQAMIYGALGKPEIDNPLLALVNLGSRNEFCTMMAELARALLEARRGEDAKAYRRLMRFGPESKPVRIQHAFADNLVAFADLVAVRNRGLAIAGYRRSRVIYRELRSKLDLQRVRRSVSSLSARDCDGAVRKVGA